MHGLREFHHDKISHVLVQGSTTPATPAEAGPATPLASHQPTSADAEPATGSKASTSASDHTPSEAPADQPAMPATASGTAALPSEVPTPSAPTPPARAEAGVPAARPVEETGAQAGVHPQAQGDAGSAAAAPAWTERVLAREPVAAQAYREEYGVIEDRAQSMALYGAQPQHSWEDATLLFLASTLTVLIIAIVFRRLLLITGTDLTALL